MVRLSFATLVLSFMLLAGCVHHHNGTARSEYQRTETTRVQEGNATGAELQPGTQSRESESIRTHEETTTTRRSR